MKETANVTYKHRLFILLFSYFVITTVRVDESRAGAIQILGHPRWTSMDRPLTEQQLLRPTFIHQLSETLH